MSELTADRVRELFDYDAATGSLTWRVTRGGTARAGSAAGGVNGNGYLVVKIHQRSYLNHRIAWFWSYGEWPLDQIDHINRDRLDNRLDNLRPASNTENRRNSSVNRNNNSGIPGVSFLGRLGKWQANIRVNRKLLYLGVFATQSDAAEVRRAAEIQHFGVFAPHHNGTGA